MGEVVRNKLRITNWSKNQTTVLRKFKKDVTLSNSKVTQ